MVTPANQSVLPMLTSQAALKTYAEEQAYSVSVSISTFLPSGGNSSGYTPVTEATAAGIMSAVKSVSLSVDVVNPSDSLFTWAEVYSMDWDVLFSGYKQYKLVGPDPSGSYAMPSDYKDLTMDMAELIPIPIAGADSAFVDDLNSKGQSQNNYNLQVRNGKVYFPKQLAGGDRILGVYTSNQSPNGSPNTNDNYVGNWVFWNIGKGGVPMHSTTYSASFSASIKGVTTMQDSDVFVVVPTIKGGYAYGGNITAELKVTTPFTSKVSFWTTEGKWFKSALVRKAGTAQWLTYIPTVDKTRGAMTFVLPVTETGTYFIIPQWNDGDLIEPADPYYPPYDGGSNG